MAASDRCLAVTLSAFLPVLVLAQTPLGSAFTYQGELKANGVAAAGVFDFEACLFVDANPLNSTPLACVEQGDRPLDAAGRFTLSLDFGAQFVGTERFLELRVRPDGNGAYVALQPRQPIRPTPEALRAASAPWSGLAGTPAGFSDDIDNDSGGDITGVGAGNGLSGGGSAGAVTLAVDTSVVQARVTGTCGVGQSITAISATGMVSCAATASGDITGVAAGTGLSGGGVAGDVGLSIAPGGVGAAQINTAQVQARVVGSCPLATYLRGINADGTALCSDLPGVNTITTVDDPANQVGQFTSLAIGIDGLPVISYYDTTAVALKVAKCANAACTDTATITTVDDPANGVGQNSAIAIGNDGLPVISYLDLTARALKVAKCVNVACTGTATITTVDDPANDVGTWTSVAIGNDGMPVISYQDFTANALKVAKCVNAACTGTATITTVDDTASNEGQYTSIAIGDDGLPVISYYNATAGTLKVAQCANAACTGTATITTVDDPVNNVGTFTSLAIGSDGLPVISYQDGTAGALKVAKCVTVACTGTATITTLDDPPSPVGFFTSLAIGSDGLPVISYGGLTGSSNLKVAKCTNASCTGTATITTVDDPTNTVGQYSSIAIGNDGLPVISYQDASISALKVAKCGTRTCR